MYRTSLLFLLIAITLGLYSCSSDTPTNSTTSANSFTISGTTFNNVRVTCANLSSGYAVNAVDLNGSNSTIGIGFPSTTMPTAGTYNVDGSGAGRVTIVVGYNAETYGTTSGSVTVTINNGMVKVDCANIPLFKAVNPSVTTTASASIQCN